MLGTVLRAAPVTVGTIYNGNSRTRDPRCRDGVTVFNDAILRLTRGGAPVIDCDWCDDASDYANPMSASGGRREDRPRRGARRHGTIAGSGHNGSRVDISPRRGSTGGSRERFADALRGSRVAREIATLACRRNRRTRFPSRQKFRVWRSFSALRQVSSADRPNARESPDARRCARLRGAMRWERSRTAARRRTLALYLISARRTPAPVAQALGAHGFSLQSALRYSVAPSPYREVRFSSTSSFLQWFVTDHAARGIQARYSISNQPSAPSIYCRASPFAPETYIESGRRRSRCAAERPTRGWYDENVSGGSIRSRGGGQPGG